MAKYLYGKRSVKKKKRLKRIKVLARRDRWKPPRWSERGTF
jgi:hypothetical protein